MEKENLNELKVGTLIKKYFLGAKETRVSVKGVKSLGKHFACLCWGFYFFYFCSKRKGKYFYTFNHFYSEKSSKRAK